MPQPRKQTSQKADLRHRQPVVELVPRTDAVPDAPDGLCGEAVERWNAFWTSTVAQAVDWQSDSGPLIRWAWAWHEWFTLRRSIGDEVMVDGSQGQPRLNPLFKRIEIIESTLLKLEERFGMAPRIRAQMGLDVARTKLTAAELNAKLKRSAADGDKQVTSKRRREIVAGYEPA